MFRFKPRLGSRLKTRRGSSRRQRRHRQASLDGLPRPSWIVYGERPREPLPCAAARPRGVAGSERDTTKGAQQLPLLTKGACLPAPPGFRVKGLGSPGRQCLCTCFVSRSCVAACSQGARPPKTIKRPRRTLHAQGGMPLRTLHASLGMQTAGAACVGQSRGSKRV
jgi:hypothetical protein